MREPEGICARCGCGIESGWQYPSCADYDTTEEQIAAHSTYCVLIGNRLCDGCRDELRAAS
jgi:hypothetical protein